MAVEQAPATGQFTGMHMAEPNEPHWSNLQEHVVASQVWSSRESDKKETDPNWLPVQ